MTKRIELKQSWRVEYPNWNFSFANAHGGQNFIDKDDYGKIITFSVSSLIRFFLFDVNIGQNPEILFTLYIIYGLIQCKDIYVSISG